LEKAGGKFKSEILSAFLNERFNEFDFSD